MQECVVRKAIQTLSAVANPSAVVPAQDVIYYGGSHTPMTSKLRCLIPSHTVADVESPILAQLQHPWCPRACTRVWGLPPLAGLIPAGCLAACPAVEIPSYDRPLLIWDVCQ